MPRDVPPFSLNFSLKNFLIWCRISDMKKNFIRVYQEFDIVDVKNHLLIFGDLSANCSQCQAIDIKLDAPHCPQCQTEFKYITFRNPKSHLPKLARLKERFPQKAIIDFDDYKRLIGAWKAQEFLK